MAHIPDSKVCAKCEIVLPVEMFGKTKQNLSGFKSYCKPCCNAENREYYARNKVTVDARNREWAKANPEAVSSHNKKWRNANKSKVKQLKQQWREENKETEAARKREWALNNPEKIRLYASKRRALKRNASVFTVTSSDIKRLEKLPCIYCGGKFEEIEHIIPLARGGSHSVGNIASSCTACNGSKGAKFVSEWKLLSKVE